jgi:pilus assembly protein FimV
VAELGITVEPDNPLYDISQITSSVAAVKSEAGSTDAVVADLDIGNDLDFSFDKPKSNSESETLLSSQAELEQDIQETQSFDLGGLNSEFSTNTIEAPVTMASVDNAVAESKPTVDNSMDFDFPELGSFTLGTEEPAAAKELATLDEASQAESAPVFELPASSASDEIDFTRADSSEDSSALAGLDFNFTTAPAVETSQDATESSDFNFEGFADNANTVEEKVGSGALDSADFNFEDFGEPVVEVNQEKSEVNALEGISLNFETEASSTLEVDDKKSEEISFDFPLVDEQETPAFDKEVSESSQNEANNFDFSAISLDLADSQPQGSAVTQDAANVQVSEFVAEAVVENENPDVDIKLDLVKVYMDMEDVEGARDLLDEVLKEGGPQQRSTAEKLLASLA